VAWTLTPCLWGYTALTGEPAAWQIGYWSLAAGVTLALPAMFAGLMDFIDLPQDEAVMPVANRHVLAMTTAWTLATLLLVFAPRDVPATRPGIWLALAGAGTIVILMAAGAHLGGRLVYHFAIGVNARNAAHERKA
jgi:uncharacterized membrane protein